MGHDHTAANPTTFEVALAAYLDAVRKRRPAPAHGMPRTIEAGAPGRRFVRIVESHACQRFVHSFVALATGDVFKADGWKRPARHRRGNIYSPSCGAEALDVNGSIWYAR